MLKSCLFILIVPKFIKNIWPNPLVEKVSPFEYMKSLLTQIRPINKF